MKVNRASCRIKIIRKQEGIILDNNNKLLFGKFLGEIFRLQKNSGISQVSDGRIYGLLNGIEESIDETLNSLELVETRKINIVCDYLEPYYQNEKSLDELPSFLNMRMELERQGINHGTLITILKYLKANDRYTLEIDRLGNYNLNDYDI